MRLTASVNHRGMELSRESRNILAWICVLIAANQIGFGMIIPAIALYAEDFGVSKTAIGLTIAVYGLARFVANVPAGQLADRFGRKTTLAIGGTITVVGSVLCAVAPSYAVFLIARFIGGAGAAVVLTGGQIVVADIASPHNRGRVMAIYQGVFLSAVAAGALPGGWLATHYGLASPFWAYAVLAGVVTMLALVFVPETKPDTSATAVTTAAIPTLRLRQQLTLLFAIPGFLLVSIVSFVNFFARTGGIFNVIPLFADERLGLDTGQIGLGISLATITSVLLVYPSGVLVDRFGRKGVIVVSTMIAGTGMLLFTIAGSFPGFLAAAFVWGIGSGVSGAAPAAYAADLAPRGMIAPALSMYRTIADLGYVIGPLLLGILSDVSSSQAALIFTGLLLFLSGTMFRLRAPETLPSAAMAPSRSPAP
jgi:DHA1 family multidrug resistance protein-like MFS transporter